jgi:thiamine biosynthesis lipoprotein
VDVGDDHRAGARAWQTVSLRSGGLATSSTTVRRWRAASGGWRHHIVDPRTGDNPAPVWRTAAVAAGSSVDANAAATAAIILGARAPRWLEPAGLPTLLIGEDGRQVRVGGWPAERARRPGKGAA